MATQPRPLDLSILEEEESPEQRQSDGLDLSVLDVTESAPSRTGRDSPRSNLLGDMSFRETGQDAWRDQASSGPGQVGLGTAAALGAYEATRIVGDPMYNAYNLMRDQIWQIEDTFSELTGRGPIDRPEPFDPTGGVEYQDLSDTEKMMFRGGETLGMGGTAMVGGTAALHQGMNMLRGPGASLVSKALTKEAPSRVDLMKLAGESMVKQFADEPGTFALVEMASATGASYGAAIMQGLAPESPTGRMAGEVVGGIFGLPRLAAKTASRLSSVARAGREEGVGAAAKKLLRSASENKQQEKLARTLQKAYQNSGIDPIEAAAVLKALDPETKSLPVGLRSGDEILIQFENRVAKQSAEFGRERKAAVQNFFKDMRSTVDSLINSGDPQALTEAARLARGHYDELLEADLVNAQRRASEAVAKIGPADKVKASEEVARIIRFAQDTGRSTERKLWDSTPKNIELDDASIVSRTINAVENDMVPGEALPAQEAIREWITNPTEPLTTGKLVRLRSKLRSEARRLRRGENADPQAASRAEQIAGSIDEQLGAVTVPEWAENPNVIHAQAFSRAFNDVYRRSFAKFATQTRGQGEAAVAPGELLEKAFGPTGTGAGGRARAARQLDELERAGAMSSPEAARQGQYFDPSVLGPEIRSREEQYLRGVVGQFTDEVDGQLTVNPSKLKNFMANNEELLERFPALRNDLLDVETAQATVRDVMDENKATQTMLDEMAFSKLLGDAVPETVMESLLFRKNQDIKKKFKDLVVVARRSGSAAKRGLVSSTLKAVMKQASSNQGESWRAFNEALQAPVSIGQKSPLELITDNQLLTKKQIDNLKTMAERGARMERQLTDPRMVEQTMQDEDFLSDVLLRIHGAWAGSEIAQRLPGAGQGRGLVISGAVSRFGQNIFRKVPIKRMQDLAAQAVNDPELMSMLLEKDLSTPQAIQQHMNQLNAYLIASGYESLMPSDQNNRRPWEEYEDIPEPWE